MLELKAKVISLSERISTLTSSINTEEATKQAFVVPFIMALGYDVFNPLEVVPEYTADVGTKKGEKVDYAILKDNTPLIIIECKKCGHVLNAADYSQLYRYFATTEAKIAILTNGVQYQFYTDLEKANLLDSTPFLELDLSKKESVRYDELFKLSKDHFDLQGLLSSASTLKYTQAIKQLVVEEFKNPSDDFTKFFASKVHEGRVTANILSEFRSIVAEAIKQHINRTINDHIKDLMIRVDDTPELKSSSALDISSYMSKKQQDNEKIETTEEEVQAFQELLNILYGHVDAKRIVWRDVVTYFGVLLDDNNRKPICRFHFNTGNKYISLFDGSDRQQDKIQIDSIADIKTYAGRLLNTVKGYD